MKKTSGISVFTFLILLGTTTVSSLIWRATHGFVQDKSVSRQPQSVEQKVDVLNGVQTGKPGQDRTTKLNKGQSSVDVSIESRSGGGGSDGSTLNLEATITAKENLHDVKYAWLIPNDGVRVINGSLQGELGELAAAGSARLHLAVASDVGENRRIHLHVYRLVNGENSGQMAQFNTLDQESIDRKGGGVSALMRARQMLHDFSKESELDSQSALNANSDSHDQRLQQ